MSWTSEKIQSKFKHVCYSPKLNKIILLDGGKIELVSMNGKHIEFYYSYADAELFGKTMKANKFERLYPIWLGDI